MQITVSGKEEQLYGNPPVNGDKLPKFKLEDANGNKVKTADLLGKVTLISTIPDINTAVCSMETRKFNQEADHYTDAQFVVVSNNTVEQQKDWCAAEGVENIRMLSDEQLSLGYAMGVYLPNFGALARTIFIVDKVGTVVYRQIVDELHDEPDYAKALAALNKVANRIDE